MHQRSSTEKNDNEKPSNDRIRDDETTTLQQAKQRNQNKPAPIPTETTETAAIRTSANVYDVLSLHVLTLMGFNFHVVTDLIRHRRRR